MEDCKERLHNPLKQAFLSNCRYEYDEKFEGCMVEVPLKRPDMDYIQVWVKIKETSDEKQEYIITDAGKTYASFFSANLNLDNKNRKNMISSVENRYDLDKAKYEVRLSADKMNLGERLLDAIQAIHSLSHLTITRQKYNPSNFREDVIQYISDHELDVREGITVRGSSREWEVDMEVMNGHKSYVETLHSSRKSAANDKATINAYMWVELRDEVSDVEFVSVIDDVDGVIEEDALRTLESRSDSVVRWSEKDHLVDTFYAL